MKTYILNPNLTFPTVATASAPRKPADRALDALVDGIAPAPPAPKFPLPAPAAPPHPLPTRQPLPTAKLDPSKPSLQLGLDVHLEFTMAVAQKDHASPQTPRKFTRQELVAQVRQWVAAGFQVFCVQESCGFGFVLHRELEAAGAQSFLITPIALNGQRKTDKLDARQLCLRLSRWLDGNRDELAPIRIPSESEQRQRAGTRRRKFLGRLIRRLGNRGHGQVAEHLHVQLPARWWGARNWPNLAALDPWVREQLESLRQLILDLESNWRRWKPNWSRGSKARCCPKAWAK